MSGSMNVLLDRVQKRTTNDYGKSVAERIEIISNFEQFSAIIEASSTISIDTNRDISSVVDEIESIANDKD